MGQLAPGGMATGRSKNDVTACPSSRHHADDGGAPRPLDEDAARLGAERDACGIGERRGTAEYLLACPRGEEKLPDSS